eukprot:TRINITY_DN103364_c0_g1_i1.p1 TRINITY_DN103364_c0_g1~~TRINITY_DN103364_c0_g1_i1.p1  ORF type:complete len:347 (+),score=73.35 TRINITY_DN103364_c0_g1_i1:80-1120(+)
MSLAFLTSASSPKPAGNMGLALQQDTAATSRATLRGAMQPPLARTPLVESLSLREGPHKTHLAAAAAAGAASLTVGAAVARRSARLHASRRLRNAAAFKRRLAVTACGAAEGEAGEGRRPLQLFLDTADEEEWDKLLTLGIFHGTTTNPLILSKSNQPCTIENCRRLMKKALSYPGIQRTLFQVWGETAENYEKIGYELFSMDPEHVGVKLPLTDAGIRAASALKQRGVRICMTGCMSAKQVLTANALHAEYISPYLGRMCDTGMDGMHEVQQMYDALKDTPGRTRVFVASIRNVGQMMELAAKGLDSFTFPVKVAYELVQVQATDEATANFEKAALEMGASTESP